MGFDPHIKCPQIMYIPPTCLLEATAQVISLPSLYHILRGKK